MAAIVPPTASAKISFFTAHVPVWAQDPPAIGTTAERVAAAQAALDEAKAALLARDHAFAAARVATQRLKQALATLDAAGGQVVAEVKVKAAADGPSVYSLARLRAPAAPSPIGKPGQSTGLSTTLRADGSLHLTWKCRHPRGAKGTIYQVYRAAGVNGDVAVLGASGKKRFTDATVPAGTRTLVYRIVAVRSTARGEMAEFPVNLGVSGTMPVTPFIPSREQRAAA